MARIYPLPDGDGHPESLAAIADKLTLILSYVASTSDSVASRRYLIAKDALANLVRTAGSCYEAVYRLELEHRKGSKA